MLRSPRGHAAASPWAAGGGMRGLGVSALRSVWLHRLRSALSTLGIVCGVISFVAMISLSEGARRETLAEIEQLGLRNVLIRGAPLTDAEHARALFEGSRGLAAADVQRLLAYAERVSQVAAVREVTAAVSAPGRGAVPMLLALTPNSATPQPPHLP